LWEKSLKISKLISGFKVQPSALFRRPVRLTWSDFSRTPTCAPFTPNVWPSCQRISSWLGGSEENEPRFFRLKNLPALSSTANQKFRNSTNHQSPRQLKYRQMLQKQTRFWRINCVFSDAILPFCVPKMKKKLLSKPKFNDLSTLIWRPLFGKPAIRVRRNILVYAIWRKNPRNCVFLPPTNANVEEVRGLNLVGFVPFFRVKILLYITKYYDPNVCILKKISNLKYVCK